MVPVVALLSDLSSSGHCSDPEEQCGHRSSTGSHTDAPLLHRHLCRDSDYEAKELGQRFSTCGSRPLWGQMTL